MHKISVVIVYWNSPDIHKCLELLFKSEGVQLEVIVVDNAANFTMHESQKNYEIQTVRNDKNEGFAKAANQGAQKASADVILFLNPDVFVKKNTLLEMLTQILEREKTGCIAPKILDENGLPIWANSRPFRNLGQMIRECFPIKVKVNSIQDGPAQSLQGSCFMMRKTLFEQLGGFDDRIALFMDDADLCLRVHKLGYQNRVCNTKVQHRGGTSIRSMPNPAMTSLVRHLADDLYLIKHHSWFHVLLHHIFLTTWTSILLPASLILLAFRPQKVWPYVKKHGAMLSYSLLFSFKTKDLPAHWEKSLFKVCRRK